MQDIKKIRVVMEKYHGGADKWTDQQIMIMWAELPPDAKAKYLASVKPKVERKKDADNIRPKDV